MKYNIIQFVYPELQNLYHWMEVEFHPLKLASRVQSSLDFIAKKDDLAPYIPALQDMTIMRVIKQVKNSSGVTLGDIAFWISLLLSREFGLSQKLSQKVKLKVDFLCELSPNFKLNESLSPKFGLSPELI